MPTDTTTQIQSPSVERIKRPLWRSAAEFLALLVVAIFILDWFFGICGIGQQEFLEPDQELGCHHIPGKLVTWRMEGFSSDRISSAGLRDVEHPIAKPSGTIRIALLGDSSTEGLQVPLNSTYGRLLQKKLTESSTMLSSRSAAATTGSDRVATRLGKTPSPPAEVINFGCSSYSTGQEMLQFEHHDIVYNPDIVVLLYNRGDSIENVRASFKANVEPRPYFYIDQAGKLQEDSTLLANPSLRPNPIFNFLRRNSHIYGVLTQADLSLSIHERFYRKLRSWVTTLLQLGSSHKHQPAVASYSKQDAMKVTDALVSRLNDDCKRHHMRFILMMFPNTVGDPELSKQAAELKKLSQQEGFGYIDLTGPFLAEKDPKSLFLLFHFSAAGHQVTADQLYSYIQ